MKLVALQCPVCAQRLAPEQDEAVVTSCPNCRTAVTLSEQGLAVAQVQYAAPVAETVTHWQPLWIFTATIHVSRRETQGGSRTAQQEAAAFWAQPRRLYLPAWPLPLHQARELGVSLLQAQPLFREMEQPERVTLETAVVDAADALKLLEFVILTLEARREDWLKTFEFTIEAGPPKLWAVPARHDGGDAWTLLAAKA